MAVRTSVRPSVRPSTRIEQLVSQLKYFKNIWYSRPLPATTLGKIH